MLIASPAIVIHSLRYSDADLIVKLFTKTDGLRSYLLRGILKSKKGKLRASFFLPLTILDIEAIHKNKGALERIKEAKVAVSFTNLHTNPIKSALVFFIAEILKNTIKEEETNAELYEYLETAVLWLDNHQDIANFHIAFLIKLTQYLGCYPDVSQMNKSYFNLLEGRFEDHETNAHCIQGGIVEVLKQFLGTTFDASMQIKLSKTLRIRVLNVLLVYFELHLHEFKKPKSLAVLNEVFN